MPNRDTRRLIALQQNARRSLLEHYNTLIGDDINSISKRRRTGTARAHKQKVISDFRTVLRNQQKNKITEFKSELFVHLNKIIKNPQRTADLMNTKDRYGYSLNYSLQRVNTRTLKKLSKLFDKSIVDSKLNTKEFYKQATDIVKENRYLQDLIDYNVARAYNQDRYDKVVDSKSRFARVRLSNRHTVFDICNEYAKVYPVDQTPIPPFHLHCNCYIVSATNAESLRQRDGAITAVDRSAHAAKTESGKTPASDAAGSVKPTARFKTTKEAEAYLEKRFPHMIVDLAGIDPAALDDIVSELDTLSIAHKEVSRRLEHFGTGREKLVPNYNMLGNVLGFRRKEDVLNEVRDVVAINNSSGRSIILNTEYSFNKYENLMYSCREDSAIGFSVGTDVKGIIRHEFGHSVDSFYDNIITLGHTTHQDDFDEDIFRDFKTMYYRVTQDLPASAGLSRYGMYNDAEKFAEAFNALKYQPNTIWIPVVQALHDLLEKYPTDKIMSILLGKAVK